MTTTLNFHPLPAVAASPEVIWVSDVEGGDSLDLLAGRSALNFGHPNAQLLKAAKAQFDRVTLTSRAFHHDRFARFWTELAGRKSSREPGPARSQASARSGVIVLSVEAIALSYTRLE